MSGKRPKNPRSATSAGKIRARPPTTSSTSPAAARGAKRMADVDAATRAALNAGTTQARTLAELLVIDFGRLMSAVAPEVDRLTCKHLSVRDGVTVRMARAGAALLARFGPEAFDRFHTHPSDTVRGWAAYALGQTPGLTLARRYERIRPLADDPNSGVREWAWIALRPAVLTDLDGAFTLGAAWVRERAPNLRRFAVEITRPRGVWCAHADALKDDPTPGLPLLEPLRAEGHKYVQDSVANWLNDAAKSRAAWVKSVCARWRRESPGAATERICRRGLRSVSAGR